jgi:hypothetical protein
MMESLSKAVKFQGRSRQGHSIAAAAAWLQCQAVTLVKPIQARSSARLLPVQDLCALAYRLPDFMAVLRDPSGVLPLTEAVAQHAAARIQRGDAPSIVRSWCDLLYGLTKAGLVVNIDRNASQVAVKQDSPHLQQLLNAGAQQLPALLQSQGAVPQDVSLTFMAYAYAGYTGDLGPVTQALASNLEGCLNEVKPQDCSNILWALGKLCELRQQERWQADVQLATYDQELSYHLLGELRKQLGEVSPQALSNAVYGCALAGHVDSAARLDLPAARAYGKGKAAGLVKQPVDGSQAGMCGAGVSAAGQAYKAAPGHATDQAPGLVQHLVGSCYPVPDSC